MIVRELIEKLNQLDQTSIVIISHDAEGNQFSPLDEYSEGYTNVSRNMYEDEEDTQDKSYPCVCLWPV